MHGHPTHPVEVRIRKLLIDAVLKNIGKLQKIKFLMRRRGGGATYYLKSIII